MHLNALLFRAVSPALTIRCSFRVGLFSLLVFWWTAPAQADELPKKEQFHLYLLIGQSNMAGRGVLSKEPQTPPERILKFSQDHQWVPAVEPLHFDKPSIAGAGLGLSFAETMATADPDVTIGLIPCAVGGTPLSRWEKDGDLYRQAVERARRALPAGTLKGILWHQGENDAGTLETAESYAERLGRMIPELRRDLGGEDVPFVAGELGLFLLEEKGGKPSYWKMVNAQLHQIPERVPFTGIVPASELKDKGDQVHFDTASLREFGKRYAEAMRQLQKN